VIGGDLRVRVYPVNCGHDTVSETFDIEAKLSRPHVDSLFLRCQQIQQ
jgi:hypothetical protein